MAEQAASGVPPWVLKLGENPILPQDPNRNSLENFIRQGLSGLWNIPKAYPLMGGAAQPAAPMSPMPGGGVPTPGLGTPSIPSRNITGGGPQTFEIPGGPALPAPPMLPPPPQMKTGGMANFSGVRSMADQAKPGPIDQADLDKAHINAVLGGLAGGAGSVDATTPGSFAKALAMSGAGGAKGAENSALRNFEANTRKNERTEDFQFKRAGLEKDIVTAQQAQSMHAADIAFKNAKLVYDTNIANQAAQYDYTLKKNGQEAPKISHDANGITIQQLDPTTRQVKVNYYPTKPIFEQMEKLKATFEALGMNTPQAKATNAEMIANTYKTNPILGRQVMTQMAVKDLVENRAGSAVFGSLYDKAAKEAQTELNSTGGAALQAKPETYLQELNSLITARLLNNPAVTGTGDWLVRAIPHSPYAGILLGGMSPNTPTAPPANAVRD